MGEEGEKEEQGIGGEERSFEIGTMSVKYVPKLLLMLRGLLCYNEAQYDLFFSSRFV